MIINSNIVIGRNLYSEYSQEEIKNEPMLFNCGSYYADKFGGSITKDFLDSLDESGIDLTSVVIDTRVHMLMPGWYPCIPGWHHDDVPRSRVDGQPNYINPEYRSQHVMALVNGDICPTQFAVGDFEVSEIPLGEVVYKKWHVEVESQLNCGSCSVVKAPSNKLIHFDDRSFHQGAPSSGSGWRWFGRASWNTHRVPTNEVRRQVQVYLENPMEGW